MDTHLMQLLQIPALGREVRFLSRHGLYAEALAEAEEALKWAEQTGSDEVCWRLSRELWPAMKTMLGAISSDQQAR